MLPIKNQKTLKAVESLESFLPIVSRNNTQSGTRYDYDFYSSGLIKSFFENGYLEGIYCDENTGHIHYRVHLETTPVIELLAADPSKNPYEVVENQLQALVPAVKAKFRREEKRREAIARGEKPKMGGPGANCSGVYIWSGDDGNSEVSLSNFKILLRKEKITEYFVKVAIRLQFAAVKYPSKNKIIHKEVA
jgi:hypothetical protein